jgi:hypothetical protein
VNHLSLLQKSVNFARRMQFLRLKPYETCIFKWLLLQNWSFATASFIRPQGRIWVKMTHFFGCRLANPESGVFSGEHKP